MIRIAAIIRISSMIYVADMIRPTAVMIHIAAMQCKAFVPFVMLYVRITGTGFIKYLCALDTWGIPLYLLSSCSKS